MKPEPDLRLAQIPVNLVDTVWNDAYPFLRSAYDRMGGDTPDQFRERLHKRECDLWGVYRGTKMVAAAITSIRGKTAFIEALGGAKMRDWVHLIGRYEELARDNGMESVRTECREGWKELLDGYRVKCIILEKAL